MGKRKVKYSAYSSKDYPFNKITWTEIKEVKEPEVGKVKEKLLHAFDIDYEKATDDYLINVAFDRSELTQLDHGDMVNLIEELARRYQRILEEQDGIRH